MEVLDIGSRCEDQERISLFGKLPNIRNTLLTTITDICHWPGNIHAGHSLLANFQ